MIKFKICSTILFIPCLVLMVSCNSNTNPPANTATAIDSATIANKKFAFTFQNGNKIVASSIDTLKQISFGGASDPAISPDGNKLAYTVNDTAGHRTIWIADLQEKSQVQILANSDNFYGAMWSGNGQKIAFSVFGKANAWKVGIVNNDNTGSLILDASSDISAYSPTWKNENEIVAHDLTNLNTYSLNGKIINSTKIAQLIGSKFEIASSNRFFYTKDGKNLVFNAGNDDKVEGLEGPNEAVYVLNLVTKKIERISPIGFNVSYISLTANNQIFYSASKKPYTTTQIFVSDLGGKTKKLVDYGDNPSGALN